MHTTQCRNNKRTINRIEGYIMKKFLSAIVIATLVSTSAFAATSNKLGTKEFKTVSFETVEAAESAIDGFVNDFESLSKHEQQLQLPIAASQYVNNSLEINDTETMVLESSKGYTGVAKVSYSYEKR